jgi:photosystem II stability/assembly factor-like uncharacterized protein
MKHSILTLIATLAFSAAAHAAEWQNISDPVTSQIPKPGYAGPTAGVVVDRTSGDVFMVVNDNGLWKSTDHGATFTRCDGKAIGGRCETGYALQADPAGKRLACFMIYGDSAMTTDGGATWSKFKSSHFDFGSVDWAGTGRRILALRHESGGKLATSEDAGATWKDLEKGFSGCGVIDPTTFIATKEKEPGIFRSTDAGATWTQVHPQKPIAGTPVVFEGAVYWASGKGVLMSRDKGATWSTLGTPVEATHGPLFGKESGHLVVVGKAGLFASKDAGQTWDAPTPLPPGFTVNRVGPNYAWDPTADIFYASTMTKPTFKFERKK